MGLYKNLFKQTAIYGLATVIPRMFSFLLVPLYTDLLPKDEYGKVTIIFAWMIFFNVILAYGMETAFFRFYNKEEDKQSVVETSMVSIFWTTIIFLVAAILFRTTLADWSGIDSQYITYSIWILVLDALVIIPFSKLRALQRPIMYAIIKIGNVLVNLLLSVLFLVYLPKLSEHNPTGLVSSFYIENFQVGYIFLANIIASLLTFVVLSPDYVFLKWKIDFTLWKRMMVYGLPILVAGIAFAINEQFDKILLSKLLPKSIADDEVGVYSACYKLGLFMVLYRTAYTLGIEPFFFSHAKNENAPQTYAMVTKYFVIFGSFIMLSVIVFADLFKFIMIRDDSYWVAMKVVPLIILANFCLGIYTNLSVWYKLIDKTYVGAYISIVGAIITLILNFLLIPSMSYVGSAIATLAAYGSMMLISYYMGNKYYPIPYDFQKIGGYLGLSILFSVVSFYYFRENYFVGISLLLLFLYFIYHNEKETLMGILKTKSKPQQ
ncbi:Membrane protein involved in the export of O-antigen and teichoic acid [Flavobacterium glycines]|uniref:Membrane protein involved in the export of O-antigen and teichoic acid n=1 Tax=Flavobacterium glycines TaxID=551990 RepID=A0A1B9DNR5_9FLAO|nr:oligosaccharide flippase family protein [Flavobacterium glycines]OCB71336.1 polysaccharide biosynthesis protein [Flavobacterium glycines]GEL10350.1 polysaccharide biosynthesis protein [Flavobacterium glycines]SDI71462.1 Membrane protein involved in the export of O-antigen and teichoic acid [Flavobacterium glycines]